MFFFILEQYVVMSHRFILAIVIDYIHFGERRIRAAQTISLQRPSGHCREGLLGPNQGG